MKILLRILLAFTGMLIGAASCGVAWEYEREKDRLRMKPELDCKVSCYEKKMPRHEYLNDKCFCWEESK